MTTANTLTLIRIFMSPLFLLVYVAHDSLFISSTLLPYILLTLLAITELTDAFDGYLARKWDEVTDLGKVFDPMADSISRIAVLLAFTRPPIELPLLLVFVFLYRDAVIGSLRTLCALKGHALAARTSGKLKAILLALISFTIVILMIPHSIGELSLETLQEVSFILIATAAIYTAYSGIDYLVANRHFLALLFSGKKQTSHG